LAEEMKSLSRADAELLYRWIVATYGDPEKLERPAGKMLAKRDNANQGDDDTADKPRLQRQKRYK
jgi:hypothetical protein